MSNINLIIIEQILVLVDKKHNRKIINIGNFIAKIKQSQANKKISFSIYNNNKLLYLLSILKKYRIILDFFQTRITDFIDLIVHKKNPEFLTRVNIIFLCSFYQEIKIYTNKIEIFLTYKKLKNFTNKNKFLKYLFHTSRGLLSQIEAFISKIGGKLFYITNL